MLRMSELARRGCFVLFEGVDRCGKTTQAKLLASALNTAGHRTEFMRFPDRTTTIGQMINAYLTNATELDDHTIHLLFSANRWEKRAEIESKLASGVNIVMDRYGPSGVAFSSAKGLSIQWCKQSDVGLPAPDHVFFLDLSPEAAEKRGEYGGERYETVTMQRQVRKNFDALMDATWEVINADNTVEALHAMLLSKTLAVMDAVADKPIAKLWEE